MAEGRVSPQIPQQAFDDATDALVKGSGFLTCTGQAETAVRAAVPALYRSWAARALDSSTGGMLHKAADKLRQIEHPEDRRAWEDVPPSVREIYLQDAEDIVAAALDGSSLVGSDD